MMNCLICQKPKISFRMCSTRWTSRWAMALYFRHIFSANLRESPLKWRYRVMAAMNFSPVMIPLRHLSQRSIYERFIPRIFTGCYVVSLAKFRYRQPI